MTLAIAHEVDGCAVLDCVRERKPPFNPADVVAEFASTMKLYRVHGVSGDRYAGEWPRERFREHEISYEAANKPKSDLYRELLPLLNSRQVELLDHSRLAAQLCNLERRTARGGRDSIDHPPGGHDAYFYWSSTTAEYSPTIAWGVTFYDGYMFSSSKSDSYYVRAVRGGS